MRAWLQTTDCKRRTLQRCDISRAIRQENMLDFLNRVVPYDHEQVLSFSLARANTHADSVRNSWIYIYNVLYVFMWLVSLVTWQLRDSICEFLLYFFMYQICGMYFILNHLVQNSLYKSIKSSFVLIII